MACRRQFGLWRPYRLYQKINMCQAGTKAVTNELRKCRSLSYRTMIGHTIPIHGYLSFKIKSTWIRLTQIISRYYPIRNLISVLACRFKCVFIMSIYLTCIFYLKYMFCFQGPFPTSALPDTNMAGKYHLFPVISHYPFLLLTHPNIHFILWTSSRKPPLY